MKLAGTGCGKMIHFCLMICKYLSDIIAIFFALGLIAAFAQNNRNKGCPRHNFKDI